LIRNTIAFTIIFILSLHLNLYGKETIKIDDTKLKQMIGQMLIIGFDESVISDNSPIVKYIEKYNIGGVILFDRFYTDRNKIKNIKSPQQLQLLTSKLKEYSKNKLIISIDQEGGKVQRLKSGYGFLSTPSAKKIAKKSITEAKKSYTTLAQMLSQNGINCNFAPVVDLSVNKNNPVIERLERSYGETPQVVTNYATVFIDALDSQKILSVLKHFPGHGSSKDDSHKGFVDVTDTWDKIELEPYKNLIKNSKAKMIMTAHVFNKHLDPNYPATLSYKINTELLRKELGYKGVIVSDDLQMKAIAEHYTLQDTVTLVINAGVDILLFGNQLSVQNTDQLIDTIYSQVKNGSISYERIIESNKRIEKLKKTFNDLISLQI